jgi:dolichol-phosphate mannosyltransferase
MISIVFPTFNEQKNVEVLYERLRHVTERIANQAFEFIFVDDCSTDTTPMLLKNLNQKDSRVKVIRFARNCGGHAAIAAGLQYAQGECVIALAADLQDPPEMIVDLLSAWKKGAKIVWAARKQRKGESFSVRFFSRIYYGLINLLTDVKMPSLGVDVFLADRVVLEALKQMPEKHTSIFMALAWLGFPQTTIEYIKEARVQGKSNWSLKKKIKLMMDSLLAFSDVLIRYMSIGGLITAFLGFAYAAWIIIKYYIFGVPVQGWASLIVAIFVIGGIQMMMLGVLGEYLWRTFDESRKRPRFVIEYRIGLNA